MTQPIAALMAKLARHSGVVQWLDTAFSGRGLRVTPDIPSAGFDSQPPRSNQQCNFKKLPAAGWSLRVHKCVQQKKLSHALRFFREASRDRVASKEPLRSCMNRRSLILQYVDYSRAVAILI